MGLETVEILLWAEDEFRIDIRDDEAKNDTQTIGGFVSFIRAKCVSVHGAEAPTEAQVFDKVANLLEQRYEVPREWIRPEVHFYKNLGLG